MYFLGVKLQTTNEQKASQYKIGVRLDLVIIFLPFQSILSMAVFLNVSFTARKCLLEDKAKKKKTQPKNNVFFCSLLSRKMVIFVKRDSPGPDTYFDKW